MEEVKKKRIGYFDALRVVAAIAVITIHVAAIKWIDLDIGSPAWEIANIFDSGMRWAVPIFVMISGALLLNPEKEFSVRKFYKKNILRIIIAFAIWSAIYVVYDFVVRRQSLSFLDVLTIFIKGEYYMWFLYMLIGLYLITPILRLITKNRNLMQYFLILGIGISFVLPGASTLANVIATTTGAEVAKHLHTAISAVVGSMSFNFISGYVVYYVLGYYLHSTYIKRDVRIMIYIYGIIALIMTILLTRNMSIAIGAKISMFGEPTAWVLALSVAVFIFFKYHGEKIGCSRITQSLSSASFGIYLIHILVMDLVLRIDYIERMSFGVQAYFLVVGLTFGLSYVAIWLAKKIPVVKEIAC